MSVMTVRGGFPRVLRATVNNTTGLEYLLPQAINYLVIRVDTAPCKVYFTQEDFDNDENYILVPVPAADAPYGEWRGPVESETSIWLMGSGGSSDVELVTFQRRG